MPLRAVPQRVFWHPDAARPPCEPARAVTSESLCQVRMCGEEMKGGSVEVLSFSLASCSVASTGRLGRLLTSARRHPWCGREKPSTTRELLVAAATFRVDVYDSECPDGSTTLNDRWDRSWDTITTVQQSPPQGARKEWVPPPGVDRVPTSSQPMPSLAQAL